MSLLDTASLIVTPNGYKEGKLYSVIPSDGSGDMSVTRATTATRVNSAGLVELVPYNLLTYSQDFTNADWIKDLNNGSFATNATAPDGTTTAQTLTAGSGNFGYCYRFVTNSSGSVYAFSFYAKKGTANFAWMQTTSSSASYVNLTTLAVSAASGVTITATNVGNGWVRIVGVSTASSSSHLFAIGGSNASGSASMTSGTTIEVWGAQLVEGSTAKDYQKTETRLNIPRLDYSNGTCPSLLVEPQRTNVCRDSNNLSGGAWINQTSNTTITRIQSGGPDGNAFDRLVVGGASGSNQGRFVQFATNVGSSAVYSVYVRGTGIGFIGLYNGASSPATTFNLTDEWVRYDTISTSGSGTYIDWAIYVLGGSTCDVAFHQVEFGSYSTSYIPTTSASVTRNADVISKSGISSLIGQTEGTLFVDAYIDIQNEELSPVVGLFALNNNASNLNNCIVIGIDRPASGTSNQIYGFVINGGTDQAILNSSNITAGRHKIAFAYKANDFVLYVNGVLIGSDTSGSVPTLSQALIGSRYNGDTYFLGDEVNAAALWKQRLTNTQLAQLTTI
jgi:hypothetical protein